jgi:hypothetical protein
MRVKGVLIEGNDGHEYLLGFSPTQLNRAPIGDVPVTVEFDD